MEKNILSETSLGVEGQITETGANDGFFIEKWDLLVWVREKTRWEDFDDLFQKLPKGLLLALQGGKKGNRAIISQITEEEYKIISVGISGRHPPQRDTSLKNIPPPLSSIIRRKVDSEYITDPLENPLTEYMLDLIKNEEINAIYYTMVETPRGTWFVIVDATGKKMEISKDERRFIDAVGQEIVAIEREFSWFEEEFQKIAHIIEAKTLQGMMTYFDHSIKNPSMAAGGLANIICKKHCDNGDDSACKKCLEKAQPIVESSSRVDEALKIFGAVSNDMNKTEEINNEKYFLSQLIHYLQLEHGKEKVVWQKIDDVNFLVDRRKIEKFSGRLLKKLLTINDGLVEIHYEKIQGEGINIHFCQANADMSLLEKYTSLTKRSASEKDCDHRGDDLELMASFQILYKMGVKYSFNDNCVIISLPKH